MRLGRGWRTRVSSAGRTGPLELAEFLRTVQVHSPFYRRLWASSDDLSLECLPTTSASTLPKDLDEMMTESGREMDVVASCGTSGRRRIRVRDALGIAAGRSTYLDVITRYGGSRPQRVAKAGIFNSTPRELEAAFRVQFQCDDVLPLDFAEPIDPITVRAFAPTLVLGSPRALLYLDRHGYLSGDEQLVSMNEPVHPWAFTGPLASSGDIYAASEFSGPVAFKCPRSGFYHAAGSLLNIETLPVDVDAGNRSVRRLVITDLANLVCPLVRYDVGDLVLVDAAVCPCGDDVLFSGFAGRRPSLSRPDLTFETDLALTVHDLEQALRGPLVWQPGDQTRADRLEVFSPEPDLAREVIGSGARIGRCALDRADVVLRDQAEVVTVPATKWHALVLDAGDQRP